MNNRPPKDPTEHAAFIAAFRRALAVKIAMKRLEMIFTGERPPQQPPLSAGD